MGVRAGKGGVSCGCGTEEHGAMNEHGLWRDGWRDGGLLFGHCDERMKISGDE